jgi:hypothetical protein
VLGLGPARSPLACPREAELLHRVLLPAEGRRRPLHGGLGTVEYLDHSEGGRRRRGVDNALQQKLSRNFDEREARRGVGWLWPRSLNAGISRLSRYGWQR